MKSLHFSPFFRVLLLAAVLRLPAMVQAQGELNTPYDLTIVVHVAENRLLTDVFRGRIERELRDGFQAALGDMGRVKVTHEHPRLPDVLARGLRSLDEWNDRDDKKTHFVLIDYSGVHYEIQARQYDGTVGRASPVVRRDRTRDRDFVAKAAALLIKQDFGVIGTVRNDPEGAKNEVKIELRGGGLGDMSRWVKKDEVFALAPPSGGSPLNLRWSLLQVEQAPTEKARDGVCVCRFFHRYKLNSIAGYRCIKLGTVQTPLRVRWIQKMPNGRVKPLLGVRLTVDVRRFGFDGAEKLQVIGDLNGVLETVGKKDGVFNNVAFVHVIDGLNKPATVPVPLYDDQPVFIEAIPANDFNSLWILRKSQWQNDVAESVRSQVHLFQRLQALGAKAENRGQIIQLADSGRKRAEADREALTKERRELVEEAKGKELKTPIEDRLLKQLEKYQDTLKQFIDKQKEAEKTENDPQLKKWLSSIAQAKLFEKELDIDKAIELYERIQQEGYPDKDGKMAEHLAALHKLWKIHSPEHEKARKFIYRLWPTLDTTRLEENIAKANEAFKTCQKADDLISIQKLLLGTLGHADRLKKKLDELHPDLVIDDEKEAQQLKGVSEKIVKLAEEIQEHLKQNSDDK